MPSASHSPKSSFNRWQVFHSLEQKAPDPQLALTDTDHWLHWRQAGLCQLQKKPSAVTELKEK